MEWKHNSKFIELLLVWDSWKSGCPKGVEKVNFSPKRPTILKMSDMKPWNLLFWKKLSVSLLLHFVWKSETIEGTFLSFSLIREWMNMNEYMIECWCFWRTPESHYSLSSWYILQISSVIEKKIVEVLVIKFWAM